MFAEHLSAKYTSAEYIYIYIYYSEYTCIYICIYKFAGRLFVICYVDTGLSHLNLSRTWIWAAPATLYRRMVLTACAAIQGFYFSVSKVASLAHISESKSKIREAPDPIVAFVVFAEFMRVSFWVLGRETGTICHHQLLQKKSEATLSSTPRSFSTIDQSSGIGLWFKNISLFDDKWTLPQSIFA